MKHHPFFTTLAIILGVLIVLVGLVYLVVLPWSAHWGATDAEVSAAMPGDELIVQPVTQVTHALTIQAPPEQVWAWLVQLGVDRGGMYSYDALENLIGLKVHSTAEIQAKWQGLAAGDFIRFTPTDYFVKPGPGAYVISMQAPNQLVACFGMEDQLPEPCTSTWQFALTGQPDGSTRLVVRTRTVDTPGFSGQVSRAFSLVSFIMERKMMLGIRARAEATP